jgi:hypothetical protein
MNLAGIVCVVQVGKHPVFTNHNKKQQSYRTLTTQRKATQLHNEVRIYLVPGL